MTKTSMFELARVIVVIAMVLFAAALATPPNKLPLALRGLVRIMRRDRGMDPRAQSKPGIVPVWKKIISFVLVILAFVLAKI